MRKTSLPLTVCALLALLLCLASLLRAASPEKMAPRSLSLAGNWSFALGGTEPAFPQAAQAPSLAFSDTIALPGTTETRNKGPEYAGHEMGGLTRLHKFDGPAWYQRDFEVPNSWAGCRIVLELERTKYTQVWLDGAALGSSALHTAPQHFELPATLAPGKHTLLILVDNRPARRAVQAEAHQYSDNTQTNWNGLLGRIQITATPQVWLDEIQVFPDLSDRSFTVRARVHNHTGAPQSATLTLAASSFNHEGPARRPAPASAQVAVEGLSATVSLRLPLGPGALAWDEFNPALYTLTATLASPAGIHTVTTEAGLREFRARDARFTINGRTTFLRGKHDGCVFPLTGHPPMDLDGWLAYLRTCRDYGINHLRCHTWVPPEAAFAAADRLGIYLQPELPFWGTFTAAVRDFLAPEADATLRAYGNHPSFVMFTLGNEIGGDRTLMNALVTRLRESDPRRLYADGSNNVLWDPRFQPSNDFWSSAKVINPASNEKQIPARGSFCVFDGNEGHVQWGPANTRVDLAAAIAGIPAPFVGHETGQWTSYPDFAEIAKYTGVTRARNLGTFRDILSRRGLAGRNAAFRRASGALAAELYREENELFLRTPGMDGFQLLDLQDFPGQGTALVGILDAFMDSKGFTTPELWRRSCDTHVALARFDRYTWTTDETYLADLELAHYGPSDLQGARVHWELRSSTGEIIASQDLAPQDLLQGGVRRLGRAEASLAGVKAPARLDLIVTVIPSDRSEARTQRDMSAAKPSVALAKEGITTNSWPVWVYPSASAPLPSAATPPAGVSLVRSYNADTKELLDSGARVVLVPDSRNWADTLPGAYATDYWCWPMFNNTPGTMGLLIEPSHPALAAFPTSFHSERQWSALAHASTPVLLGGLPAALEPAVRVIDNLERNESLGLVFELRVGRGSLLVCGIDLPSLAPKHPEARQLLASLLAYAASPAFAPRVEATPAALDTVLRPNLARDRQVAASSFFQPPWGAIPSPARAIDGDANTRWIAAEGDRAPSLTVDLGGIHSVDTVQPVWEQDEAGYAWTAESSLDGSIWAPLCGMPHSSATAESSPSASHSAPEAAVSPGATAGSPGRHTVSFAPVQARFVRLNAKAHPAGRRFCLRDLRILGR